MPDKDPKTITTVCDFLIELEKGGALLKAWRAGKRACLDSTSLADRFKKMIMDADASNDLGPIRKQVEDDLGGQTKVCLYVK